MADTVPAGSRRAEAREVDLGRVAVVVLFALTLLTTCARIAVSLATWPGTTVTRVLDLVASLLTLAFTGLVIAVYLRRGPAVATDRSPLVRMAAPLATCLPLLVPLIPMAPGAEKRALIAVPVIVAGSAWSVWALRYLATCLSIVPQARALVDGGPYRFIRHPLYLGEVVALAGFAIRSGHVTAYLLTLALLLLQAYRASREENLLIAQVPGYAAYAARTWRVIPGLL